ncbi:MAG TPA: Smr/MutS family protein [Polyangiaceae bacterium]
MNRPFQSLRSARSPEPRPKNFADAMKGEGTVPLREGVRRVPPSRLPKPNAVVAEGPAFSLTCEEDWVEGHRAGLSASVRRRLGGTPTATLDLHGYDSDAARRRVARFVATERHRGRELVLVIVGKGRHSAGGRAVLRGEIAEWLAATAGVLAFRTAPRELGGSGAVVVLLSR